MGNPFSRRDQAARAGLTSARRALEAAMPECDLQQAVMDLLSLRGWLWFHDYDSRRNPAGLPDLLAVKGRRVIAIELKSEKGRTRPEQRVWLEKLAYAGIETYEFRPQDWTSGHIERVLV